MHILRYDLSHQPHSLTGDTVDDIAAIRQVIDLALQIMPPETNQPLQLIEEALATLANSKESERWKALAEKLLVYATETPFENDVGYYTALGGFFHGYVVVLARREKAKGIK